MRRLIIGCLCALSLVALGALAQTRGGVIDASNQVRPAGVAQGLGGGMGLGGGTGGFAGGGGDDGLGGGGGGVPLAPIDHQVGAIDHSAPPRPQ